MNHACEPIKSFAERVSHIGAPLLLFTSSLQGGGWILFERYSRQACDHLRAVCLRISGAVDRGESFPLAISCKD